MSESEFEMKVYLKIQSFFESRWFILLSVMLGAGFVVCEREAYGAIFLLNLGAFALLFCENIISAFTPALVASAFVIKCYDSASLFLPLWWTAIFPIVAILAYLIIFRREITVGKSFYGLLAVAVSVTIGGLFTISSEEYFSPVAIYYVIMLGFGMVAAYLFVRAHIRESTRYDVFERFILIMTAVGLFACFVVFEHYAVNFRETILAGKLADIQWSNNISTLIMYSMPFVLWYMRKSFAFFPLLLINYGALLLSGSRGAWVMGTVELLVCLVVYCLLAEKGKFKTVAVSLFCVAVAAVVGVAAWKFTVYENKGWAFLAHDDVRIRLVARSFEDFSENPIFGKGVGNTDNSDLYNGKKGTMVWYHMMIPQIFGGFGIIGMYCYGKQMADRFVMIFKRKDAYVWIVGLSYIGMLLMSQVNPGEFCPLPYGLLVVVTFIMIEKYQEKGLQAVPYFILQSASAKRSMSREELNTPKLARTAPSVVPSVLCPRAEQ